MALTAVERLTGISSIPQLCTHLQCRADDIYEILENPGDHYEPHLVPRRMGSRRPRQVYSNSPLLRRIHQAIAIMVGPASAALPDCVQGFRAGSSPFKQAKQHCGRAFVVTADLSDFFDNIRIDTVVDTFQRLGSPRRIAVLLGKLCTHNGSLPQGGRASPVLSNLCVTDLDDALTNHGQAKGLAYSRYADDLAFSGDNPIGIASLRRLVAPFGFSIREDSFRLQAAHKGQYVTGLNVTGSTPRIPREVRRKVDAAVRFASTFGLIEHLARRYPGRRINPNAYLRRLYGLAAAYKPVEPDTCEAWLAQLAAVRLKPADSAE